MLRQESEVPDRVILQPLELLDVLDDLGAEQPGGADASAPAANWMLGPIMHSSACPFRVCAENFLLVFTDVELDNPSEPSYGLYAGDCTTVVHARSNATLARPSRPDSPLLQVRHAALRFSAEADIPDAHPGENRLAAPMQDVHLPDADIEKWWKVRQRLNRNRLGHKLLGYRDATGNGDEDPCARRTQRGSTPWRHLVTVAPDYGVFEVADGGTLEVVVRPDDLRRGRFNRVCGIFYSG
ncbi:MAG: YwqG family protein [Actinomycetota bacterium]|nr:YwqG family protein [Actinomycetota bacterium]